jgi:hypothetical protein
LGIRSKHGLQHSSRSRDYLFEIVAGRRAGSATVYLDPTGEFPWQDRADLAITTLAEIAALLEN